MGRLATLCIVVGSAAAASAGHFFLQVTLRDGRTVTGYVPESRAAFEGVTADGQKVKTRFERLPGFAKREWHEEIAWDKERDVFILRAPSWTGELKRIWDQLVLDPRPPADPKLGTAERELDAALADDKKITVRGSDVAEVKLRFVDPATEVVKPGKKKGN